MAGRPNGFTEKIGLEICRRISEGDSLRTICKDSKMPSQSMVFRWLTSQDEFREQYGAAMTARADAMFEEMLEIANEGNPGDTQRARLRVDALKWALSRMNPKKYGDKTQTEISGAGGALPNIQIKFVGGGDWEPGDVPPSSVPPAGKK